MRCAPVQGATEVVQRRGVVGVEADLSRAKVKKSEKEKPKQRQTNQERRNKTNEIRKEEGEVSK